MTTPGFLATVTSPASTAPRYSMPVPTKGASERSSGTAWRCMFAPIRARDASSCSRNGIIAVATETIWRGETSMYWMSLAGTVSGSALRRRASTRSSAKWPSSVSVAFAWAIV